MLLWFGLVYTKSSGPVHTMSVWFENGITNLVAAWFFHGLTDWRHDSFTRSHDAGMEQILLTAPSSVDKWWHHIVSALFHSEISLDVAPSWNPTGIGCSHNDRKSFVFISHRQAYILRFHSIPFSSKFHTGIMWTGGLSVMILFRFQIIYTGIVWTGPQLTFAVTSRYDWSKASEVWSFNLFCSTLKLAWMSHRHETLPALGVHITTGKVSFSFHTDKHIYCVFIPYRHHVNGRPIRDDFVPFSNHIYRHRVNGASVDVCCYFKIRLIQGEWSLVIQFIFCAPPPPPHMEKYAGKHSPRNFYLILTDQIHLWKKKLVQQTP